MPRCCSSLRLCRQDNEVSPRAAANEFPRIHLVVIIIFSECRYIFPCGGAQETFGSLQMTLIFPRDRAKLHASSDSVHLSKLRRDCCDYTEPLLTFIITRAERIAVRLCYRGTYPQILTVRASRKHGFPFDLSPVVGLRNRNQFILPIYPKLVIFNSLLYSDLSCRHLIWGAAMTGNLEDIPTSKENDRNYFQRST